MKRKFLGYFLLAALGLITIPSCSGGGGGDPEPPAEADLVVVTTPVINGQTESPAPGPNFPLAVSITSTMPPQGVKIDVVATPDGSSTAFFTESKTTSTPANNFTITNTPSGQVCRVTVTVTSVSKPTNKKTGFYLYSRK
ncbi:hypothetical protein KJS94_12780 [Flavihumibacter rivuli]|uniref:hypothetical protein n=1 Tax=Flavihumibacter rivuli TaxID=2838156 RepID=UPI001BDE45F5|nr:hypothetical protein [Flavihumibacter rivuli]ULQ55519.1 hypothetical protein KJS94_12780 [Flavihumibacter rivuli]